MLLLAGCEIEDDLQINADGSGTYRATITVGKLAGHVLERIRSTAERDGFRIVDRGETLTERYVVVRKDFTEIHALNGQQSSFDLSIETHRYFWRRYRLRASVGSVAGASFDRRFTITMPAEVKTTTAGNNEGNRVTWYCANGGTIDIMAEGFHVPFAWYHVVVVVVAAGGIVALVLFARKRALVAASLDDNRCVICGQPLSSDVRYCPGCGERTRSSLESAPQRPRGFP